MGHSLYISGHADFYPSQSQIEHIELFENVDNMKARFAKAGIQVIVGPQRYRHMATQANVSGIGSFQMGTFQMAAISYGCATLLKVYLGSLFLAEPCVLLAQGVIHMS